MFIRILIIIVIAVVLRAPYAWVPFFNVDEALIAVMADTFLDGGVLYRDVWEHQAPLSYFIYSLVFILFGKNNMTAIHLFGIGWIICTALMIFKLADKFYGNKVKPGFLAALFYVIFISTYESWDVLAVNTEIFLVLPITAAIFFLLRGENTQNSRFFIFSGILCGLGALAKQTGGIVLPALIGYLIIIQLLQRGKVPWRETIKRCLLVVLGFSLVIGMLLVYFWMHGALWDFYYLTVQHPFEYSALVDFDYFKYRFKVRTLDIVIPNLLLWGVACLTTGYIVIRGLKKYSVRGVPHEWNSTDRAELLLVLWLFASLIGLSMSGRFFGHYYIQAFPVLSLLAAYGVLIFSEKIMNRGISTSFMKMVVWTVVFVGIVIPVFKYQKKNITRFIINKNNPQLEYDQFELSFNPVADYVRKHTTSNDSIFVWGFCPQIYVLSDRRPASRFIFCNFLTGRMTESPRHFAFDAETDDQITPGSWEMLRDDLSRVKPRFIIDTSPSDYLKYAKYPIKKYSYLKELLERDYNLEIRISSMDLYRLKS